jgi:amino acid adenylation domain-containing protein
MIDKALFTMGEFQEAKEYWLNKLAGDLKGSAIPADFPGAAGYQQATVGFELNQNLAAPVFQTGRNQDLAIFIILLGAYKVLLYKLFEQEDTVVPAPAYFHGAIEEPSRQYVIFRDKLHDGLTCREVLSAVKGTVLDGYRNQHFSIPKILEFLEADESTILRSLFGCQSLHSDYALERFLAERMIETALFFEANGDRLQGKIVYNAALFRPNSMERLADSYLFILEQFLTNADTTLGAIREVSVTEQQRILSQFSPGCAKYPKNGILHRLVEEQVDRTPASPAIYCGDVQLSYEELERRANRLANFLLQHEGIEPETPIGILSEDPIQQAVAILGILKSGGAYVPMDARLPGERMKTIINEARLRLILTDSRNIETLNKLQWECPGFQTFLCMDADDPWRSDGQGTNELMDPKLWEYVGRNATDAIQGGGWVNSYTGADLTTAEMDEYSENALQKLRPYLHPGAKVLEIGCASGITMFKVAPLVGLYYGTDLSRVIIEKNRERAQRENFTNIKLAALPADQIDRIEESEFDVIIMNSVIQCFNGYNYLRQVIAKAIGLLGDRGILFCGDIMDQERKEQLIRSLREYRAEHPESKTKNDLSNELFIARDFFLDLAHDQPFIHEMSFSDKIHTIANELTRFRYDAILWIDKANRRGGISGSKHKNQLGAGALAAYSEARPVTAVGPNHAAYIIFTSGTTGQPKGVVIEHGSIAGTIRWRRDEYKLDSSDSVLQLFSYSFDGYLTSFFTPLASGSRVVALPGADAKNPVAIKNCLAQQRITHFICVPPLYQAILDCARPEELQSLRRVTLAGDKADPDTIRRSLSLKPDLELVNEYGPTEASVAATFRRGMDPDTVAVIGRPIADTSIYILNRNQQVRPVGVPGELWIGGYRIARGYLNHDELTMAKFPASPFESNQRMYRTGDRVRWRPDGTIEFFGRVDHQVKIRGFRIELGEIETQLRRHESIREAAVVVRERSGAERTLHAYFTADRSLIGTELRDYLSESIPEYMIPASFRQLEQMPLSAAGKLDRKALSERDERIVSSQKYEAPRDALECQMVQLWQDLLDMPRVGIDDNFFELGGHSLKATALLSRIYKTFKIELQLGDVFQNQTVRKLAARLQRAVPGSYNPIPPAPEADFYPVSAAQQRLYILSQFAGAGAAYNVFGALKLEGPLDRDRLAVVFRQLAQRHESFRTSFMIRDGRIMQKIQQSVALEIADLTLAGADWRGAMPGFIRPFDLESAPLLRVGLIRLNSDEHIMLIDMHHIISDGTSMGILLREFIDSYDGKVLSEPGIQYKDFAVWQNSPAYAESVKPQKQYWLNTFTEPVVPLDLPTDHPRTAPAGFEGDAVKLRLDPETTAALKQLALQHEATLFMALFAAYTVVLAKLTGQDDILVGTPVAGRNHPDLEGVIGIFLNTVVLRSHPRSERIFSEFLAEVKADCIRAFENQDFQFEMLLDRLALPRDLSRTPLFDTMFNLLNMFETDRALSGATLRISPVDLDPGLTKFDINIYLAEVKSEIVIDCHYRTRLFKRATIEYLMNEYLSLLRMVAADPARTIAEYRLFERPGIPVSIYQAKPRSEFDAFTDREIEQTLVTRFESRVARFADRIAIQSGQTVLTYQELNRLANRVAHAVLATESHGPAVLLFEHEYPMVVAMLGALKAGRIYVPLDPGYPLHRLEFMVNDSGAGIIITNGPNRELAEALSRRAGTRLSIINVDALNDPREEDPQLALEPDRIAYILYTSGSTGHPKGVVQNHRNILYYISRYTNRLHLNPADRLTLLSSFSHDAAVVDIFSALLNGCALCLYDVKTQGVSGLKRWMNEAGITVYHSIPTLYRYFLDSLDSGDDFANVRLVVLGGEPMIRKDVERFRNTFSAEAIFVNLLGSSEASITAMNLIDRNTEIYRNAVPIGVPLDGTELRLVDEKGRDVPFYRDAEIVYYSPYLALGYWNLPAKTDAVFGTDPERRCRFYRSGDLGRAFPDGRIEFMGRNDYQAKIRGYRVDTAEIEAVLLKNPLLKEAIVVTRRDEREENVLCAYLVAAIKLDPMEIRSFLSDHLPDYMIPALFVQLDRIPLTPNGKIDRKALPEPERPIGNTEFRPPQNETERKLAGLWTEILGIDPIGLKDSFFELGGHSLKATSLIARVHRQFGVELPLAEVFRRPTLQELAAAIESEVETLRHYQRLEEILNEIEAAGER